MKYLHLFPSAAHNEVIAFANYSKEVTPEALDVLLRSGQAQSMSSDVAGLYMQGLRRHASQFVDVIVHR